MVPQHVGAKPSRPSSSPAVGMQHAGVPGTSHAVSMIDGTMMYNEIIDRELLYFML